MLLDREHAGRLLAQELEHLRAERPIVLGVSRGGVPVAVEVARALDAPLELVAARKVGALECPEYTIAAVAEGGAAYVRHEALRDVGMTAAEADDLVAAAAADLTDRVRSLRGDAAPRALDGRTALLVDDGVATGATACAAARAVRLRGASRIVFAAPVVAAAATPELRRELDEAFALEWPRPVVAVGIWYERFERVSEDAVLRILAGEAHVPRREAERLWEGDLPERPAPASDPVSGLSSVAVSIPLEGVGLVEADLVLPRRARGVVVFGTGSTRESPRFRVVSRALQRAGVGTLRCDLLSPVERRTHPGRIPTEPRSLAARIAAAIRWISTYPTTRGLRRGLYGAGAGAEAVLVAAAGDELVDAVAVRAGQLDTVPPLVLSSVRAPVLLVVGSRDENVLSANRAALAHLTTADLAVVPGATDLFGEPGALEAVGRLAADWFGHWLERAAARGPAPGLHAAGGAPAPWR